MGSSAGTSAKPPSNLSEAEFLAQQAEQARQAMSRTLQDLANALKEGTDPRAWTQQYPLASLGVAAALGFVVASAVTPASDQTLQERLRSLVPQAPPAPAAPPAQAPGAPKSSPLWSIAGPLLDAFKTALVSTVSAAVSAKVQQPQGASPGPEAYAPPPGSREYEYDVGSSQT